MKLSPLYEPFQLGRMKLKNRLVVAPMVSVFCDEDGYATERFIRYHETKAQGGWGAIIIEDYAVDPVARGFHTAGLWKDDQIESHKELTQRVHAAGSKIIAQVYHAGRQSSKNIHGQQVVSASPLPCPVMGEVPKQLSIEEIEKIVTQFGDTALRAKKAGFDGVEIHGAHGYLIAQFMSKYSNKRSDKYGGNLLNRLRFPLEIIAEVRKKVGPDFFIGFRISADEHVPGGRTIEETKAVVRLLEKQGIDGIHVSAGVYESTWAIIPPMNITNGWIVDYAAEVKKVVDIPVMTVGRINDPLVAETILTSKKADLIAMGRGSLADPALPNKYLQGNYDDVRQCIACNQGCLSTLFVNTPIRCMVNPTCGFEYLDEFTPAKEPKKITVVGGGPAGMEAARTAALRGHHVTLYEKNDYFGGEFLTAVIPPTKGEMSSFISWSENQLRKLGVDLKLGQEYTKEILENEKPDKVIIATGATPTIPLIEGIDNDKIVTAIDVLWGKASTGQNVVVAGGGLIGCETATYLASLGKNVTIIEQLPTIGDEEEFTRKIFLMKDLESSHVKIMTNTTIKKFNEQSVEVTCNNETMQIPVDSIVLALGMKPNTALVDEIKDLVDYEIIGDAVTASNAVDAIREGFLAATKI